ncbi:divalent metal cation transporter [Burkholderia sp. WAC0059]|uniref:Nramp family divalent metal transporter n=1 Tax=Burkholderia sp. WAC0059 TaxID=2066022 RepID=UPI000C7F48F3|nr:Nramp family divalent metal transporter [Burkholderia sp. WAC0059]PLZ01705.1 divalent metal cation transporter [Burkholderia sp. WAC0059]
MPPILKLIQANAAPMSGATERTERAAREAMNGRRTGLRAFLPFVGPAVIASVGYMDPGNFATNIQAGSTTGYELLWVVALASLVAMLFQAMSAKLGIVTGRNLAELCRDQFPRPVVLGMWGASEAAAMATDIAEFLGGALGVSLLFHVSMFAGMVVTGLVTSAILMLDRGGFRPLEIAIALLVATIGLSYVCELAVAPPDWHAALVGTVVPRLHGASSVTLAVGIIGATIMPHTLYLHSGLTQHRTPARNETERRRLLSFSNREVLVALGIAGFVNLAMVMMAASAFSKSAPGISDIGVAYHALVPLLGVGAATVFLVSLMASGMSSSAVGTMAGQVIMQGFVDFRIPVWTRRIVTMVPAFVIGLNCDTVNAMVISQVVLSFLLPLPLVALVVLSSRRAVMGRYVAGKATICMAALATAAIVALNVVLVWQALA